MAAAIQRDAVLERRRQGLITKTGNSRAQHVLVQPAGPIASRLGEEPY